MRVFSVDHKVSGPQCAITSLLSLLLAFGLILVLRWYLAWPTQPVPLAGRWLGSTNAAGRSRNELVGRMHFWGSLIGMNGIFLPTLIQEPAGLNRWPYDYSASGAADDFLPPSQP